jgi:hypothetical protein
MPKRNGDRMNVSSSLCTVSEQNKMLVINHKEEEGKEQVEGNEKVKEKEKFVE